MVLPSENTVILIGEDQELIETLRVLINGLDGYSVVEVVDNHDAKAIEESIGYDPPQIIVYNIEEKSNVKGIRELKKKYKRTEVMAICPDSTEKMIFDTLHAGATGIMVNDGNYVNMLESVKELSNGGAPMSSNVSRMVVESFHKKSESPLSDRELEVLNLLVQGKPYSAIGEELGISKETAKSHLKNIYKKLAVKNKSEAIRVALAENWVSGTQNL